MIPFSVLDLAPITAGSDAGEAFEHSLDLARHAERLGYHRYWLAEHHSLPGVASAATSLVISHVARGTRKIRVGSGGIMLPNHAPLVIAEQFGTLEALYPGRIDLGLGRAPGGDPRTARALRRNLGSNGDTFPHDLRELQSYFKPAKKGDSLRAVPGAGMKLPLFLLGSSDFSARLAAELGMPFAFASHFAPDYLKTALTLYRRHFLPSETTKKPQALVCANVFAAETDAEAQLLFTSLQQQFLDLIRGHPDELQPPSEEVTRTWQPSEELQVKRMTRCSLVGSAQTVREGLIKLIGDTSASEIMATAQIHNHRARLRSFEIFAEVMKSLG